MIKKRVSNRSQNNMGERTYKYDMFCAGAWANGYGGMNVSLLIYKLMLYPNGYLNMNQNGEYTKHYYADALRIASKIGSGFSQDLCVEAFQIDNQYPGYLDERRNEQYNEMMEELTELINGDQIMDINPLHYPNDLCNLLGNGYEPALFFYHPDHLGSTGMVTDNYANITQGFLYTPFGELLYEYSPGWQSGIIPKYAFNAKELDEENNMYYYSARYYAPPTFISRDPLFEKYPFISPYAYCANNPVKYVDPTGEDIELTFFGKYTAELLKYVINNGLGGQFEAYYTKGKNGGYLLNLRTTEGGGDLSKMTDQQKAFYNELSGMINDHSVTAQIGVVWGSKEICIGNYKKNTIDIADINQFDDLGKGLATKQGKLIHELKEQFRKAQLGYKKGDDGGYNSSHKSGIAAENRVNGSYRGNERYNRGTITQEYIKNGATFLYSYNTREKIIKVSRTNIKK
ncbi:MAG: RHS repeat-associated core domain-containing protein [Bacteroidales bacterium]|nr:RHS repeat-associated core domain-containing protein [Bacteroidales bacterium]